MEELRAQGEAGKALEGQRKWGLPGVEWGCGGEGSIVKVSAAGTERDSEVMERETGTRTAVLMRSGAVVCGEAAAFPPMIRPQ